MSNPEAEFTRLLFALGGATALAFTSDNPRAKEIGMELWGTLPLIRALCTVGRRHEQELLAAWREELGAPMPFGREPVGLPKDEPAPVG